MIIVSQVKRNIINFNNINLIGTDGEGAIRARLGIEDNVHLGAYATEERAKEVLQEIIEYYNELKRDVTYAQGDGGYTFNTKFYYEMPKE